MPWRILCPSGEEYRAWSLAARPGRDPGLRRGGLCGFPGMLSSSAPRVPGGGRHLVRESDPKPVEFWLCPDGRGRVRGRVGVKPPGDWRGLPGAGLPGSGRGRRTSMGPVLGSLGEQRRQPVTQGPLGELAEVILYPAAPVIKNHGERQALQAVTQATGQFHRLASAQ